MFDPFARHNNQTEVVERQNFRRRFVALQCFLQRLRNLVAVAPVFHVNQIENDNSAQIAQSNLAGDFVNRFHIRFRNRIFEPRISASDEFAGVDINRHQSLGLIDDEIAAGF